MLVKNATIKSSKRFVLLATALSSFTMTAHATFPDLDSMLHASPNTIVAPNGVLLTTALNALPWDLQQNALESLSPLADGSLTVVSDGAMRQFLSSIDDRLRDVTEHEVIHGTGYAAGDEPDEAKSNETKPNEAKASEVKTNEVKANDKAKADPAAHKSASVVAVHSQEKKGDEKKEVLVKTGSGTQGAWMQVVGSSVDQDERDDVLGYDAHVWGLIIGRDARFRSNIKLGLAGGYQQARAYSDIYSGTFVDIKRYQLSAYGRYDYAKCFYLTGVLTGAANTYDTKRKILVAPSAASTTISNIARSSFTAWETDVYVENGYEWKNYPWRINPKLFLTYSHFDPESYIEQDAFNLDLMVKYQDMDFLSIAGGAKVDYEAQFAKAIVIPEIHAYYFYSLVNDKQIGTANFISGGFAFLTQGATPANNSIEVGASLAVHSYKNVLVKLQYDYFAREDYHRNQGFIKVRYEWA